MEEPRPDHGKSNAATKQVRNAAATNYWIICREENVVSLGPNLNIDSPTAVCATSRMQLSRATAKRL